jgi:hypothetical protein
LNTLSDRSILTTATLAAFLLAFGLASRPASAQTLVHDYSFNGNANDSVGSANGTLVGTPTFTTTNGDTSINLGTGNYVSLPNNINLGLTNATVEAFITGYSPNGGSFQPIVEFDNAPSGNNASSYFLLDAGRQDTAGNPISLDLTTGGNASAQTLTGNHATDPAGLHQEVATFSGFTTPGSTGTITLYYDGSQIGQKTATDTFDSLGATGFDSIGGANVNFPSTFFTGSLTDVRIYNGALSGSQVAASFLAGPNSSPVPEASTTISFGLLLALGLGGMAVAAKRKKSAAQA